MSRPRSTRPATCPLCEAMCGVLVDVDGDRIRSVRGDPDDPFSRGYVCPKAAALADLHDDHDRIRRPLVRAGSEWRDASWDEALDRAAAGLAAVRRRHGRDAVALYYGNPVAHNLGLLTRVHVKKVGDLPLGYCASTDRPILRVGGLQPCPRRS